MGAFDFLDEDPNKTVVMPRSRPRPEKPTAQWKHFAAAVAAVSLLSIVGALAVFGAMGLVQHRAPVAEAAATRRLSPAEMAMDDAREHVRNQLLSPRSAIFPDECEVKEINSRFFIVSSYVDAHNAFGTHVRHRWRVRVRYEKDGSVLFSDTVIH